ncbi:MAG: Ig-like domain-containing protein, partial [Actinomycetes bacterium]
LLLYGGRAFSECGSNLTGGTWVWNGADFSLVVPPGSSSFYSRLVFDAATHQMLRVDGTMADDSTAVDTISQWTGSAWQVLSPAHKPPSRQGDTSAYDAKTGQLILFGGGGPGGADGDTWNWTGTDWQELHPARSPSPRHLQTMGYDDATGQLLLYGGIDSTGYRSDTWAWNGTSWNQRSPAHDPGPLVNSSMAYDPALHALVLFGGMSGVGVTSGATWKWSGADWVSLSSASGPADTDWPSMAYDAGHRQLVVLAPLFDKPGGVAHELFVLTAPTVTALQVSGGSAGQPVTLSATVTAKDVRAPAGSVAFSQDGHPVAACAAVPVVDGSAACTFAAAAGSHTFRSTYAPSPGFQASGSAKVAATVS